MTENGKVTVAQDELGNSIRVSKNNPEFGHVRLVQEKVGFGTGGWVKKSTRSTLIHGTVEDLQAVGLGESKELPGNIVIREQLEPFSTNDPERDYKIAGDTGIICCRDGEPIYRKSFYSMDPTEQDVLIAHTNGNAIREANGAPAKTVLSAEKIAELTNSNEEPKTSKRKKKETTEVEDTIEEIVEEEVVDVEDGSFEL
tara:strand:- start:1745 stop:2341 length:597 start_codon:yes stop_codon:yes gene_type:complete